MPIQFIDGRSHIKKRRGHKTALLDYYACLSRDLLLMSLGADTHTHTPTFVDETIQETRRAWVCSPHMPGLINFEFKKGEGITIKSKEASS